MISLDMSSGIRVGVLHCDWTEVYHCLTDIDKVLGYNVDGNRVMLIMYQEKLNLVHLINLIDCTQKFKKI